MESNVIAGLPSMGLLPPADYNIILGEQDYVLTVPKKGKFEDLIADEDVHGLENFKGDFVVYDDETGVFYPPVFTSVLLAMKKYPDIRSEATKFPMFSIKAIVNSGDEVQVVGEIVTLITE